MCVCICLSVCLLVTTGSSTKAAEPLEVSIGVWTCMLGPGNHVFRGDPDPARETGNLGLLPVCCEVQRIPGVSQSYSVGGSSDAAFHCQYCSNFNQELPK